MAIDKDIPSDHHRAVMPAVVAQRAAAITVAILFVAWLIDYSIV